MFSEGWWLSFLATFLSIFSLWGSTCLFLSTCTMKREEEKQNNLKKLYDDPLLSTHASFEALNKIESSDLIINEVAWLSFCDFFVSIWAIVGWLPQLWDGDNVWASSSGLCYFGGLFMQIFFCGSVLWYSTIAMHYLLKLYFKKYATSTNSTLYHHIFVWGITTILAIVPVCTDVYGQVATTQNAHHDVECWVKRPQYFLIIYIPVLVGCTLACILCVVMIGGFYDNKQIPIPESKLKYRLILFSIVFIFVWLGGLIDRITEVINGSYHPPVWMLTFHQFIYAWGFFNYLIWSNSENFQHITLQQIYLCCTDCQLRNHQQNELSHDTISIPNR